MKFGGDGLVTWIYDFFPSQQSGEYLFYPVKVNPFTFEPMEAGLQLTPLRAYAHEVPHYYLQNFGSAESHPDTKEYAAFAQDTTRVTNRLRSTWACAGICGLSRRQGWFRTPCFRLPGRFRFNPTTSRRAPDSPIRSATIAR